MVIANNRIDWMVHKDTILAPPIVPSIILESSTARNRKSAMNNRREKQSRAARRALGEQVIGYNLLNLIILFVRSGLVGLS